MSGPIIGIGTMFGAWEALVRLMNVKRVVLPTPTAVLGHLAERPSFYLHHSRLTVVEAVLGMGLAFVCAFLVAVVLVHSDLAERAVLPVAVVVQVTPIVALAPAIVTWLGFGLAPKVLIAALVCFVPFLVNALAGFRAIDPASHELFRSVDAGKLAVFWHLRLPQSLPYLFSAAKIAVGLALIGAVIAEWFGSTGGLGYQVRSAQARVLINQLWASIFMLALVGVTFVVIIGLVERRVLRWHLPKDVV